eukprot:c36956_g1_i1 orf=75-860(+)
MQAYRRAGSSSTERLWKDYFANPSQWWDKRKTKTNSKSPDFMHKASRKYLWMEDDANPSWVKGMLQKVVCQTDLACKEPKRQQDSVDGDVESWQMLSLEKVVTSLESGRMPESQLSAENLACILNKCKKEQNLPCALRLQAYLKKRGLEAQNLLGNYLVSLLVEVERVHDAQKIFDKLLYRSECSWNSLIRGYDRCGESQHALSLYRKMQEDCIRPSGYTFVALLKTCVKLKDVQRGQELHADIARKRLDTNIFVGSTLVD